MIIVKVEYRQDKITKVEVKGHAGFAKHGKDIVCSAVSAIVQTALIGLIDIADASVKYVMDEDTGYLRIDVPEFSDPNKELQAQAVLRAMYLGVCDVEKGYKAYVKTEVKQKCL